MSEIKDDSYTLLLMYKDYTFLMHLACYNASSLYFYIKVALNFINILMSSSLSMMNSSAMNIEILTNMTEKTFNKMMIVVKSSVVINLCICISSAILYYFQIAERELFFKIQADNHLKLNHVILSEMSTSKYIDKSFVKFVMQEFMFLIENMHFAIPSFVKRNIKVYYSSYHIPPLLDVYIHNFNMLAKIKNLTFFRIFRHKPQQNNTFVMSNQPKSPKLSKHLKLSPILKNYSFDSCKSYYNLEEDPYTSNMAVCVYIRE